MDIPKDIQKESGSDCYPDGVTIRGYCPSKQVHVGQVKKAMNALSNAKDPSFWWEEALRLQMQGRR